MWMHAKRIVQEIIKICLCLTLVVPCLDKLIVIPHAGDGKCEILSHGYKRLVVSLLSAPMDILELTTGSNTLDLSNPYL